MDFIYLKIYIANPRATAKIIFKNKKPIEEIKYVRRTVQLDSNKAEKKKNKLKVSKYLVNCIANHIDHNFKYEWPKHAT